MFHTCRAVINPMLDRGDGRIINIGSVAGMIGLASNATGFERFGEPDDIANLVAFLASGEAKFIGGQNYPVCGVMNLGMVDSLT